MTVNYTESIKGVNNGILEDRNNIYKGGLFVILKFIHDACCMCTMKKTKSSSKHFTKVNSLAIAFEQNSTFANRIQFCKVSLYFLFEQHLKLFYHNCALM